ncbi:hypothetical protein HMPREF0080_00175 [Anaeroglobus geminatus F0357]|jgi:hypothetical protein|uniref:Uncharacterized protein n=1 Tax=Anaeroglobus geminatus F0357 TaxID=861450 RepID=G9YEW5_9FIRM|nr:hypothetical protein HMPREF0080_00175 [Anaeroglobus geminatus F0357]
MERAVDERVCEIIKYGAYSVIKEKRKLVLWKRVILSSALTKVNRIIWFLYYLGVPISPVKGIIYAVIENGQAGSERSGIVTV